MHCAQSFSQASLRIALRPQRIGRRQFCALRSRCVAQASPVEDDIATQTPVVLSDLQLEELRQTFEQNDGKYDIAIVTALERKVGLPAKDWFPEDEIEEISTQGFATPEQFGRLCEANLIIESKLVEYRKAFEAVDTSGNGSIGFDELSDLLRFLDSPMSDAKLTDLMVQYDKDESGQIEFNEFLLMFQDQILDLKEVLKYTRESDKLEPVTPGLIRLKKGEVTKIFTESEFDEIMDRNRDRLIVVFAGLTWCRPCRAMTKTYEKYAAQNKDVIFLKFFGNANASTKTLFVQRLKAKATPAFFFFRNQELVHSYTGNNKDKLDNGLEMFGSKAK